MTIEYEPYKKEDKHWVDKDPDNKKTYVIDITDEMTKNGINAVSVTVAEAYRMVVTKGPTIEIDEGKTYVKYQCTGPTPVTPDKPDDAHITVRVVGDGDGDDDDCTVYFNPVNK